MKSYSILMMIAVLVGSSAYCYDIDIQDILRNLPGQSRWNPIYVTSDSPGSERWRPLYTTEAEPGLMRTLGKKFIKVIEDSDKLKEKVEESNKALAEWLFQPRDQWKTFKDIAYVGAMGITIPAISLITMKGSSAIIDIIKYKMTLPKIEILQKEAGPIYGRWDRVARWWSGYQSPTVIFDQSVKDYLFEIQEKTKNIKDHIYRGDKSVT